MLVFKPLVSASVGFGGGYVIWTDYKRYPRMVEKYQRGSILPPFKQNHFEIKYVDRPGEEAKLKEVLKPEFTNQYYLVNGEVGCGKTRTMIHLTREMVATDGRKLEGAPIYVSGLQGKCFSDSLADAVDFRFDEHISFGAFMTYALKIKSFPKKDDHNKLLRVLDAIEDSAFMYTNKHGKPVVLIIDNAGKLEEHLPNSMRKLQEKAKLWADTNTVKVVFVTSEDHTEFVMQADHCNWSRAATPVTIGDLTREEAIQFLTSAGMLECDEASQQPTMSAQQAEYIYESIGGKMLHLVAFKYDCRQGVAMEKTLARLREKELEKFLQISGQPTLWKAIRQLKDAPGMQCKLGDFLKQNTKEDVIALTKAHVFKVERGTDNIYVRFESALTQAVTQEFYNQLK